MTKILPSVTVKTMGYDLHHGPKGRYIVPTKEVAPDLLIGDEGQAFELGGRRFEIIWTPGGETRCLPNSRRPF
jgi:glyoxylase-like metal-dependent hydrolase (beta-lactamase superfamily II)